MKLKQRSATKPIGLKEGEGIKFTLSADKLGIVVDMLSTYVDVISSIIREISSNAIDAHKEAEDLATLSYEELLVAYNYYLDIPEEETRALMAHCADKIIGNIKISFEESQWLDDSPILVISDNGTGISPHRFEKIYSSYFSSTKNETENQIGAYGRGAKSPLGYTKQFSVVTVYQGWEYRYLIHKGEEIPIALLEESKPTDADNGTRVEVPLKLDDIPAFKAACTVQLAYFTDVDFIDADVDPDVEILFGKHFVVRSDAKVTTGKFTYGGEPVKEPRMHLCIGHVHYPLDHDQISRFLPESIVTKWYNLGIGLRFTKEEFKDLDLMGDRESVEYTDLTKTSIAAKVVLAIKEIQTIASNKNTDYDEPREFLKAIVVENDNNSFSMTIGKKCTIWGTRGIIKQASVVYKGKDLEVSGNTFESIIGFMFQVRIKVGANGREPVEKQHDRTVGNLVKSWVIEGSCKNIILCDRDDVVTAGKTSTISKEISSSSVTGMIYVLTPLTCDEFDAKQKALTRRYWRKDTFGQEARGFRDGLATDLWDAMLADGILHIKDILISEYESLNKEIEMGVMCSRHARLGRTHVEYAQKWNKEITVRGNFSELDGWTQYDNYKIYQHEKFVKYGRLLIYGGMKEEDKLFMANRLLHVSSIKKNNFLVIKISAENIKHMEHIGAMSVDDFILLRNPRAARIIIRTLSTLETQWTINNFEILTFDWGRINLLKGLDGEWGEIAITLSRALDLWTKASYLTSDIWDFYADYEKYRIEHNAIMYSVENNDLIVKLKDLILLVEQFPLLMSTDTQTEQKLLNDYLELKENRAWVLRARKNQTKHV